MTDLTISPEKATLLGIPMSFAVIAAVVVSYQSLWHVNPLVLAFHFTPGWLIGPLIFAAIGAHELIHAATWSIAGGLRASDFKIGVHWRLLMPYAHPIVPIRAGAYKLGAFAPTAILGLVPSLLGLSLQDPVLAGWGSILLALGCGDWMVIAKVIHVPKSALLQDHPTRVGCEIVNENPYLSHS